MDSPKGRSKLIQLVDDITKKLENKDNEITVYSTLMKSFINDDNCMKPAFHHILIGFLEPINISLASLLEIEKESGPDPHA